MDFGLMTVDGTAHRSAYNLSNEPGSDEPASGGDAVKNRGSGSAKVPNFFLRSNSATSGDCGNGKATMLSFSSSKCEEIPFLSSCGEDSSKSICFPLFQSQQKRGPHSAYAIGGFNESSCGSSARLSGPFTPSQWMELEHQALIYKHIVANVPIPSNLLIPITKSLNPYFLSGLSSGSYASNWGWGAFHLGFSANTDPEPGRCRRTDGKKWRCSRDAVPDQKYCERHINRGRHRSRKPVEGQTGHAVSGSTTTSKVSQIAANSSAPTASVISCDDGTSNSFFNNSQPTAANPSTHHLLNNRTQGSMISIQKQNDNPYKESSQLGFGFLPSELVHNPMQRRPFVNSNNSDTLLDFNGQVSQEHHQVHHFMDGWTKEQSIRAPLPKELKSDWTRLSMSIPITSSDFSSTSNSPQQEKPMRLSRELEPFQMGLGMSNNDIIEPIQKTSWGNSMGGPLGEALAGKTTTNLNLITEMWNSSPYVGSSPTGVLQRSMFASLSNSSAGSSPRGGDNKKIEGARLSDDMIGPNVVSSLSVPTL